jgi:hypothetical protein
MAIVAVGLVLLLVLVVLPIVSLARHLRAGEQIEPTSFGRSFRRRRRAKSEV